MSGFKAKFFLFSFLILFLSVVNAGSIEQVNDGMYKGYLEDRSSFEFVLERLSDKNYLHWKYFIHNQLQGRIEHLGEGSLHFRKVLQEVSYTDNEIWIAYLNDTDNKRIVMYVTVASSPNALITSHMGIAKTKEAFEAELNGFKGYKGTSMLLHSFAARIMLLRNEQRKYMINAPAHVMEKIVYNSLPKGTVFIGTRSEMDHLFNPISFEQYAASEQGIQEADRIRENFVKGAEKSLKKFNNLLEMEGWDQTYADFQDDQGALNYLVANPEAKSFYLKEMSDEFLKRKLTASYESYRDGIMGHFMQFLFKERNTDRFKEFVGQNLPVIDRKDGIFYVYDSPEAQEPFLTIKPGDVDYNWLSTGPVKPAGATHYIAVDLNALANFAF